MALTNWEDFFDSSPSPEKEQWPTPPAIHKVLQETFFPGFGLPYRRHYRTMPPMPPYITEIDYAKLEEKITAVLVKPRDSSTLIRIDSFGYSFADAYANIYGAKGMEMKWELGSFKAAPEEPIPARKRRVPRHVQELTTRWRKKKWR